jgi:hypothetical protein
VRRVFHHEVIVLGGSSLIIIVLIEMAEFLVIFPFDRDALGNFRIEMDMSSFSRRRLKPGRG